MINQDDIKAGKYDWVWEAIKTGQKVRLWNGEGAIIRGSIEGFVPSYELPFLTGGLWFENCEPIKTETRVKDPVSLMQWFVDHDYRSDIDGNWVAPDSSAVWLPEMWQSCGKQAVKYHCLPGWLEEVEVE